jgi:energy-coupling factor transporter ATP-binding protein EcfA2
MIFQYKRGNNPNLSYAKNIPFLNRIVRFKPGVNIIVGPNGSGKSSLIYGLAKLFLAEQNGVMRMTGCAANLGQLKRGSGLHGELTFSDSVKHNGKPIVYEKIYDTGYFDDDDIMGSMLSIKAQRHTSSGEASKYHFNVLQKAVSGAQGLDVGEMVEESSLKYNSFYEGLARQWYAWFVDGITSDEGGATLLMDEPTAGWDIPSKKVFWDYVSEPGDYQLIIATHDRIPLRQGWRKHIVETEKGYVDKVLSI